MTDRPASSGTDSIGKPEFIALVAAMMALNALSTNVMLPGLPQIGVSLGVTGENGPQLVVSAYLAGMALALLPFGPVADRFGRRRPLLFGLALYVLASVAAIFASSFEVLLALRFIQGVGAASTRVLPLAIIRDRFQGKAMAEVMSLVLMVFMVVPVIAPLLGQGAMLFGDWHLTFVLMTAAGALVAAWVALRLPETQDGASRRPFTLAGIAGAFRIVFGNRIANFYVAASAVMFGSLFGFINSAQQVFVDTYGLGAWFPAFFAAISATMAIGSFLNARLVRRLGIAPLTHGALIAFLAISLAWAVLSQAGVATLAVTVVCLTLAMALFGLIVANLNALVMSPLGRVAGAAASVQAFMQTAGGALIGAIIGQAFDGTVAPLAIGFAAIGAIALIFVLIAESGRLFRHAVEHERR